MHFAFFSNSSDGFPISAPCVTVKMSAMLDYTGDKMNVHSNNALSEGHKTKLRNQIIAGARNYYKYLAGKIFKSVCENGMEVNVRLYTFVLGGFKKC